MIPAADAIPEDTVKAREWNSVLWLIFDVWGYFSWLPATPEGSATVERLVNGIAVESVTEDSAVWELMYFGKAGADKK